LKGGRIYLTPPESLNTQDMSPRPRLRRARPRASAATSRAPAFKIGLGAEDAADEADARRGVIGGGIASVGAHARRELTSPRRPSYGAPIVLVVDDGETNRDLVQAYLSDIDCRLRMAEDGPEALASIQDETPDLVLLD